MACAGECDYNGRPMTLQEFERLRMDMERNKFRSDSVDPVLFGIERGRFEKQKLQKLIDLGQGVRSKTVQAKIERWKRQLKRLDGSMERLNALKDELKVSRLEVRAPQPFPKTVSSRVRVE